MSWRSLGGLPARTGSTAAPAVATLAVIVAVVELLSFLPGGLSSDSSGFSHPVGPSTPSPIESAHPTALAEDPLASGQSPVEDDNGSAYCAGSCGTNSLTATDTTGGVAEGDILVAALTTYGETAPNLGAGNVSDAYGASPWTMLGSPTSWDATSSDYTYVFISSPTTIAGSGSVSVSFTDDSTTDASLAWYSFTGVNPTTPIEAWNTATSSTPGTNPLVSVTTTNPNDVVLGFVGDSATVSAQPTVATSGFTGSDFTSTDVNTYVEYESVSSAGTQTSSPTLNSATNYAIWVLALQGQGADLSPDVGLPYYTYVGVTGYGYTPLSSITITFGGSSVATCSSNASGDLSGCTFLVPQDYPGLYTVTVSDGTHTAYSPFTIEYGCADSLGEAAGQPTFVMGLGTTETFNWYIFNPAACPEIISVDVPSFSGSDPPTMTAFPSFFTIGPRQIQTVQLSVSMPNDLSDAGQGWTRIAGATMVSYCGGGGACISGGVAKICQVVVPTPTFSEIGLPAGLPWSVAFNGVTSSLTTDGGTDSLYFAYEYPGSYAYSVADVPGYSQSSIPSSGTEVVSGADFGQVLYYAVSAAISVTPDQGPVGATYEVTGSGFSESSDATVAFNGVVQTPTGGSDCSFVGSTITTDGSGGFVCRFAVPSAPPGPYDIVGADVATSTETSPQGFTVTPRISIDPDRGPGGATYTVMGSGFSESSEASVSFAGVPQTPTGGSDCSYAGTAITTDPSGAFACTFAVPSLSPGPYAVEGEDATTSTSTAAVTFSVTTPKVSLSPAQGPSGTFVGASGSGFTPGATITISISAGGTLGSGGSCVATAAGKFSGPGCSFTITGAPGRYTLTSAGGDGSFDSATSSFTVTKPAIEVAPGQGPVGAAVSISGTGFSVSKSVGLVFDGVTISTCAGGSLTTNSKGRFSCAFTVPGGTSGNKVVATDILGATASAKFRVTTPKIGVDPKRGAVGTTVIVSGTGFSVSSTIALVFDGVTISACTAGSLATTPSGTFSCTVNVPAGTVGTTVLATDPGGQMATAKFTVT